MITGTILKNGIIKLVIESSDPLDGELLKLLDGATVKLTSEGFRLGDKTVPFGLLIEKNIVKTDAK